MGADLVSIDDQAEMDFVLSLSFSYELFVAFALKLLKADGVVEYSCCCYRELSVNVSNVTVLNVCEIVTALFLD